MIHDALNALIGEERKNMPPVPSFEATRNSISRAAEQGYRIGKAEAEASSSPAELGDIAAFLGAKVARIHSLRAIPGALFDEQPESPYAHLGLPAELERRLVGLLAVPDHIPHNLTAWFAYNTAEIVGRKPDTPMTDVWAQLRDRRQEEGGFPDTYRVDELSAISAAVQTAQYVAADYINGLQGKV